MIAGVMTDLVGEYDATSGSEKLPSTIVLHGTTLREGPMPTA